MPIGDGGRAAPVRVTSGVKHQPERLAQVPRELELGGAAARDMLPIKPGYVMETASMSEI
jgi:hypothetical protein